MAEQPGFERMSKPLHINWDGNSPPAGNARKHLPEMVADYFAQGRHLLASNPKPAELHALRLATKRLRYTLELFRPCYGPGLGTRIAALRELQGLLGEINDTAAAERTLERILNGNSPQRTNIETFLRREGESKAAEFRKHWKGVFDAPGQEQWWTNYLARNARKP
jgi:CHAD domain-containing protein